MLPPPVPHRPKRGFALPIGRWLRQDLRSWTTAMLYSGSSRLHAYVDRDPVTDLVREHLGGGADHGTTLFTLITLEEWLRRERW